MIQEIQHIYCANENNQNGKPTKLQWIFIYCGQSHEMEKEIELSISYNNSFQNQNRPCWLNSICLLGVGLIWDKKKE